jgi:hypothetical protein
MLIRFLRDFQGVNTGEVFFEAGTEIDHPNGAALVAEGAAEVVVIEVRAGQVEETEKKPKARA